MFPYLCLCVFTCICFLCFIFFPFWFCIFSFVSNAHLYFTKISKPYWMWYHINRNYVPPRLKPPKNQAILCYETFVSGTMDQWILPWPLPVVSLKPSWETDWPWLNQPTHDHQQLAATQTDEKQWKIMKNSEK